LLFCFLTFAFASAQTFTVNGITYNVLSATTNVEVAANNCYTGVLTLPSSVSNSGTTYSVTKIGISAFYNCTTITSVIIPTSVTSIEVIAFMKCSALTSVIIPNSVTSIGGGAFELCSSLKSVMIPNSITSIGQSAFSGYTALTSVICDITTPLVIDTTVFSGVAQNACSLKVPAGSVSMYQSAAVWKNFNPILPESSLDTNDITSQKNILLYPNPVHNEVILEVKNSTNSKLEVYDANGKVVLKKSLNNAKNSIDTSSLPAGLYLFKVGNSVTKVIKN
jgi:hypothetical protein